MSRFYDGLVRAARFIIRRFFREVEVTGLEHLPPDGGGVLVSWHPNGLIDPILILAHFPRRVIFGARHGLFSWPVLGQLMKAAGAVPVYRAMDAGKLDPEARRIANEKSLDALASEVALGSFSCLFPEGDSHDSPPSPRAEVGCGPLLLPGPAAPGRGPRRQGGPRTRRPRTTRTARRAARAGSARGAPRCWRARRRWARRGQAFAHTACPISTG